METRNLLAGDGIMDTTPSADDPQEETESVRVLHNEAQPTDVNNDGSTSAMDALLVINHLALHEFGIGLDIANERELYFDVDNDDAVTALDALNVINFLVFGEDEENSAQDPDSDEDDDLDREDSGAECEDECDDEPNDELDEEEEEVGEEDELDEEDDEELGEEDEVDGEEESENEVGEGDELDEEDEGDEEVEDEDDPEDHGEEDECDRDSDDEMNGEDGDEDEDEDTDTGSDSDADNDSDNGSDSDSDNDSDNGSDSGTDSDSDNDSDTDVDQNPDSDNLNLQIDDSQLGTTEGFEIRTDGIFAVWWDPQAGPLEPGADVVFDLLEEVRNDLTTNLGFSDPPNPEAGFYFNVFVHRGEDDRFPTFFGNGVGFEAPTELPDLALPVGLHDDRSNVLHEGFHVFQTSSNYEVVDTNPDAVWIVEGSAEWYQAFRNPTDPRSFIVAGSPYALPHLSWWYTPGREPEGVVDDNGWLYGVREYAMSSFLYYLTSVESVDPAVIGGVYSTNSELTAQEYIFNAVGGDNLREMFADWAVRTAAGLDYLTDEQVDVALNELNAEATPEEIKNNVLELTDAEANGSFSPDQELTPGGWAYNSIKINNSRDATYTIDVVGDATGSQGASSHFEARVAVVNGQTTTYHDIAMGDNLSGQFVLNTTSADSEIYVVIASTPDQLNGNQTYDYQVDISTATV